MEDRLARRGAEGRPGGALATAEGAVREAIARGLDGRQPCEVFGALSDEAWLWAHTDGLRSIPELADYLPGLPPEEVQRGYTGSAGEETLQEGFSAYHLFLRLYDRHAGGALRRQFLTSAVGGVGSSVSSFGK